MNTINILLIEDDPATYNLLEQTVSKIPGDTVYNVDRADTCEKAAQRLRTQEHDVYFVDHAPKSGDAIELIKKAVSIEGHEGPFILLSETDDPGLYATSLQFGVYGYILKKELSPSLIRRTITYTLEHKRIRSALKEEKTLTSFIVSEIPYLVVSIDKQGLISSVNPAFIQVTGYKNAEVRCRPWKQVIAGSEQQPLNFLVSDEGSLYFDAPLTTQDGHEKLIQWTVLSKSAQTSGVKDSSLILSGKDITNQAEIQAKERQKQRMESLGHLAGGVAHEINNLLQPILLSADILDTRPDKDEALDKNAKRILRNAQAAAEIVSDILMFSRKDTQERAIMPLKKALEDALTLTADMLPGTTKIETDYGELLDSHNVCINSTEMLHVISNLAINASHAMDKKGAVRIRTQPVTFREGCERLDLKAGPYVKIDISDSGQGIPEELRDNIFDPFFTTKEVGSGTGLGLPIAYNILKHWDGAIDLESTPGEGTTFSLYVPVAE